MMKVTKYEIYISKYKLDRILKSTEINEVTGFELETLNTEEHQKTKMKSR